MNACFSNLRNLLIVEIVGSVLAAGAAFAQQPQEKSAAGDSRRKTGAQRSAGADNGAGASRHSQRGSGEGFTWRAGAAVSDAGG